MWKTWLGIRALCCAPDGMQVRQRWDGAAEAAGPVGKVMVKTLLD